MYQNYSTNHMMYSNKSISRDFVLFSFMNDMQRPLAYKSLWTFEPGLVTKKVHRLSVYKQKIEKKGGNGGLSSTRSVSSYLVRVKYVSVGLPIYIFIYNFCQDFLTHISITHALHHVSRYLNPPSSGKKSKEFVNLTMLT